MIVIDTSIVAPMVLTDKVPPPSDLMATLAAGPLIAPAHWPIETANMLLVAFRKQRLTAHRWPAALAQVKELGVDVSAPPDGRTLLGISRLAERERLTAYDAAYLYLALGTAASLASLDGDLVRAARRHDVPVLTYP